MNFNLFKDFGALNSGSVFNAFAEGVRSLGHEVSYHNYDSDVAVIWSVLWKGRMSRNEHVWQHYRKLNKPVIVLEVGGIHRGETWKVGLNGIGKDSFVYYDTDPVRSQKHGLELKPWSRTGSKILICLQQTRSLQWAGMPSPEEWVKMCIKEIRKYTLKDIVVRLHPRERVNLRLDPSISIDVPKKEKFTYDNYNIDFSDVYCTVNWSSNPGPESILSGVPVICGPASLCYDISNTFRNLENLDYYDRTKWVEEYSYTEWTLEEISKGIPVRRLISLL